MALSFGRLQRENLGVDMFLFYPLHFLSVFVGMAVALGHLYREKVDVDICDVVGVLAAANLLKCRFLIEG